MQRALHRWLSTHVPGRVRGPWQRHQAKAAPGKWQALARRQRTVRCWVEPGIRMELPTDGELARLIYIRHFEHAERQFTRRALLPGEVYVDIGANIGLFSLIAADRVGPAGRVWAFEPASHTFATLERNLHLNGFRHVTATRTAISDGPGEATLHLAVAGHDAWNSLAQPYVGDSTQSERVPMQAWDTFSAAHGLMGKVALMKVDVEGWEAHVLRGAEQTLRRDDAPTLMIEMMDEAAARAGSSCRAMHEQLLSWGFKVLRLNDDGSALEEQPLLTRYVNLNLIATRRRAELAHRLAHFRGR